MVPIAVAQSSAVGSPDVTRAEQHDLVAGRHVVIADVEHELVHADRARDPVAPTVDRDLADVGQMARYAVGVAERDQGERGLRGRRVAVAVGDAVTRPAPAWPARPACVSVIAGRRPELGGVADLRAGRQAVDRDAGPDQVVVRLRAAQRRGRVREVPDLRARDPAAAATSSASSKASRCALDRRVAGVVGVRQVRPDRRPPRRSVGLRLRGRLDQVRPVGGLRAAATETGVDLEVHAGRPPGRARRPRRPASSAHVALTPTSTSGGGHGGPVVGRAEQPGEGRRVDAGRAQRQAPRRPSRPRARSRHPRARPAPTGTMPWP